MSIVRSRSEGGLAWVEITRPEKLNALNRATLLQLRETLETVTSDPHTRVVLLTGAGERAFAAGADIAEMNAQDRAGIRAMMELGKSVALLLEEAPQPVIAVVRGYALGGGCELALACDLICASESASFGLPEVDLAVLPGWGGSQRLERRVGYGRARDMILTGRHVAAGEALSWGLCDRVFPAADLQAEAESLARTLAAKDPSALGAAKLALRRRSELPLAASLAVETELFVDLFDREQRRAAMGLFLERN